MLRPLFAVFSAGLLLVACGVHHGPISAGSLHRLHSQAVTPLEAHTMLKGGRFKTHSHPPADSMRLPMRRDDAGLPIIEATINGRPASSLMLDTGATVTVLSAALATRTDLATVPGVAPKMQGVLGTESGMGAIIESLQLGGWRLENLPCVIRLQKSSAGIDYLGQDFDLSVLGFHLANQHCSYLTFDYKAKEIEFGFHKTFAGPNMKKHIRSTYRLSSGVPMVTLRSGKVSWEAIVDTGSSFGVEIDQKIAARLGQATGGTAVDAPFVMVGVGGTTSPKDAGVRIITVPNLRMLGHEFKKAQLDVMPGPPRIGTFFLQNYRVTFDIRRRCIWLEW